MSFIVNLPPVQCFVKKEYLLNHDSGYGEYTPCIWISAKSIKGRALYIESLLTEYGALYDKLPISAYVWKFLDTNDAEYPLEYLQIWDCLSYDITVIQKDNLKGLRCSVYMKSRFNQPGEYMFTIDSCHQNPNIINTTLSETPNEHKSFNIIKLDNGQFAAQPNNRIKFFDQSLIAKNTREADLKVSTIEYYCERGDKWTAGDDSNYMYELNQI